MFQKISLLVIVAVLFVEGAPDYRSRDDTLKISRDLPEEKAFLQPQSRFGQNVFLSFLSPIINSVFSVPSHNATSNVDKTSHSIPSLIRNQAPHVSKFVKKSFIIPLTTEPIESIVIKVHPEQESVIVKSEIFMGKTAESEPFSEESEIKFKMSDLDYLNIAIPIFKKHDSIVVDEMSPDKKVIKTENKHDEIKKDEPQITDVPQSAPKTDNNIALQKNADVIITNGDNDLKSLNDQIIETDELNQINAANLKSNEQQITDSKPITALPISRPTE